MLLIKDEFLKLVEKAISAVMGSLSDTEKNYTRDKAGKIFDLIQELDSKGFLKSLSQKEIIGIRKNFETVLKNITGVRNLYKTFLDIVERNGTGVPRTEVSIFDEKSNQYTLTMLQVATMIGWVYASLCEVIKFCLTEIIDFNKMGKREPTGLGQIVYVLNQTGITNLVFFDDLDAKVRNSFFHLTFEFQGDKVYCDNNSSKDYITLGDLIWLIIHADRSSFALLNVCEYIFTKSP